MRYYLLIMCGNDIWLAMWRILYCIGSDNNNIMYMGINYIMGWLVKVVSGGKGNGAVGENSGWRRWGVVPTWAGFIWSSRWFPKPTWSQKAKLVLCLCVEQNKGRPLPSHSQVGCWSEGKTVKGLCWFQFQCPNPSPQSNFVPNVQILFSHNSLKHKIPLYPLFIEYFTWCLFILLYQNKDM